MFSVIAIILTLALIMFLAFKKVNIVIISVLAAFILALLDGQNLLTAMTDTFMTGTVNYIKSFFLLFCVSAFFGVLMEKSGAAAAIAKLLTNLLGEKFAIVGVIVAGMILCYGGISALVIAFTMYPLALAIFKRADLPRRLIPGAIAAGCFTFAAAALPGTPQTVNVIPTSYIGTTVNAAPALGLICGAIGIALTLIYMYREGAKARKNGESFEADEATMAKLLEAEKIGDNVNAFLALIPILVIIVLLVAFNVNVLLTMLIGCGVCMLLFHKNFEWKNMLKYGEEGVKSGMNAAVTTGAIVGYGSVVSASAGYTLLSEALLNLNTTPLLSFSLATMILSGAAGSGTGGLAIVMDSMSSSYLAMGVAPEVLHRIGTLSAIGLDSLPHNGAVVVLLTLCGLTHKDSYKQIFVTTVVFTVIVALIGVVLGTIMY